jgi:hypothetical protein
MKIINDKIIFLVSCGIFGGTILGLSCFTLMSWLNGKNHFFNNYEISGSFGGFSGIIFGVMVGSILGAILMKRFKIINYLKSSIILVLAAVFLPFICAIIISLPNFLSDVGVFIVLPVTLIFILFSGILSIIVVLIGDWLKNKFRK